MKILINSSTLTPPLSGVGRYTQELISRLLMQNSIQDIQAFSSGRLISRQELKKQLLQSPINSKQHFVREQIKRIPVARRIKHLIDNQLIKKKLSEYQDYIYWEPN